MQSHFKLDNNPNIILKYHKVNIINITWDFPKVLTFALFQNLALISEMAPQMFTSFVLLWKGVDQASEEEEWQMAVSKNSAGEGLR